MHALNIEIYKYAILVPQIFASPDVRSSILQISGFYQINLLRAHRSAKWMFLMANMNQA